MVSVALSCAQALRVGRTKTEPGCRWSSVWRLAQSQSCIGQMGKFGPGSPWSGPLFPICYEVLKTFLFYVEDCFEGNAPNALKV